MGVSVVCRMGPGVPCDSSLLGGCGFRQGTVEPAAPGTVHSPERSDSGLRVELWRRESAGTCLGYDLSLQDGADVTGRRRPGLSQTIFSKAGAELHLVGKPQRPLREKRVR